MKQNVYLFQPQDLVGSNGQLRAWLPYSVASIWAYISQFDYLLEKFDLAQVYCTKESAQTILDTLDNPKICGFSSFVWNFNYNLTIAKQIKDKWPKCIIVFGGPHLTKQTLTKHLFIDSIIEAEGEFLFKEFLDDYIAGDIKNWYTKQRITDLTILPSAYSTDIFDKLILQYPEFTWSVVIETNRGCPYHCTFCDWGSITNSKIFTTSIERLKIELDWIKNTPKVTQINVADANFGIMKERDLIIAKLLRTTVDQGRVSRIDVCYTKTFNESLYNIIKVLDQPTGFQMSFQSHNPATLVAIKRKNLSPTDVMKLLHYAEHNYITHEQEYILGLPLETKQSWYDGMTHLLDTGQHKVFDVFLCSVLPNTELSTTASRKKYGLTTILTAELNNVGPRNNAKIVEYSEIINSTNTLSKSELIDCYLFTAIIIHAHCTGYTYIISRIAYNTFNITSSVFYRELEKALYNDKVFGEFITYLKTLLSEILTTGTTTDNSFKNEGRFDHIGYQFFYKNKNRLIDIAVQLLQTLSGCSNEIATEAEHLQLNYIFDLSQQPTSTITNQFNIDTFTINPTSYQINSNISKIEFLEQWKGNGSFHDLHQSKRLINSIAKLAVKKTSAKIIPIAITE